MAQERIDIDISNEPRVCELVSRVEVMGVPAVLQIDNEDVAILTLPKGPKRRTGILTDNDPLLDLVGAFESNVPGGVSANKHEGLVKAKRAHCGE